MANIKNITLNGTLYDIKDEVARNEIGTLNNLNTVDKTSTVNAVNEIGNVLRNVPLTKNTVTGQYIKITDGANYQINNLSITPIDNALTNVSVVICGRNLLDIDNNTIISSRQYISLMPINIPIGTYTFNYTTSDAETAISWAFKNASQTNLVTGNRTGQQSTTFTLSEEAKYLTFYTNGTITLTNLCLNEGTDTTYEPYQGQTMSINVSAQTGWEGLVTYDGITNIIPSQSANISCTYFKNSLNSIGNLDDLDTVIKSSLVGAMNEVVDAINVLKKRDQHIYGFHINGNESNPSDMVTYLEDSVGFTPCSMNFANDTFDYGSWANAFFMPRPCMLNTDGTIAYYLNPTDYSKKTDGSNSDVADTSFNGNAMMEWGAKNHIWWKMVPDELDPLSGSFYISNTQVDSDYHDYNYELGADRFYTAIYNGSSVDNKLRSISGVTPIKSNTAQQEMSKAQANGVGYQIETYVDRLLINCLLILMGKSADTQTVFGKGMSTNSNSESLLLNTGTMNTKGLFWGENTGTAGVKIFGMENFYGNQWRRLVGLVLDNTVQKVKLTRDTRDGSTCVEYNTSGEGYIAIEDSDPTGTSNGYISQMIFNSYGMFPKNIIGSSSTYYTDGLLFNTSQVNFAAIGGCINSGSVVGAMYLYLSGLASTSWWNFGACLSYKPLA